MWEWHIAYKGDQNEDEQLIEPPDYESTRELFREANAFGSYRLGDLDVSGMWVFDRSSENADVILIFGHVPPNIRASHAGFEERKKAPPERG